MMPHLGGASTSIDDNNKNHTNIVILASSNLNEQPKIILTFDDNWEEQLQYVKPQSK
ncbi:MAG: hypothetical protein WA461_11155 [Nitrososphaeraceae archaeon]